MRTSRHERVNCRCGYAIDSATAVKGDGSPSEGDVALCMRCGAFLVFDAALLPRVATRRQERELLRSRQAAYLLALRGGLRQFWAKRRQSDL
jgi:hypothetical protein